MAILKYWLVFNVGSSSLKATLFDQRLRRILDASCKNIHAKSSILEVNGVKKSCRIGGDLSKAFSLLMKQVDTQVDRDQIGGVGHRFIHGGWKYSESRKIDTPTLRHLETLKDLAPLHNPECLAIIHASRRFFGPQVLQVAVFDTAFHRTLPPVASHYAIPKRLASKHHIERYGFHGISHAFLSEQFGKKHAKLITLHLGNGCSAAAISHGTSIETSMGFSPAEGLVMGTRSGNVDFAVLEYLAKMEKMTLKEVVHFLNFESGLLGLSGRSADMKTVEQRYEQDENCRLAVDLFCYRIVQYIGAYVAVLGGVNAIVFSGGIGENAPRIRQIIADKLGWLGAKISSPKNLAAIHLAPGAVKELNAPGSAISIYAAASDEDLFIAKETVNVSRQKLPR